VSTLLSIYDERTRAVLEDEAADAGRNTAAQMARRLLGGWAANADPNAYANPYADAYAYAYANAYADADADANAYANADADAYAYANADAEPSPRALDEGGSHVKPGLYLFATPSGGRAVLRVGWIRRVDGDEYEVVGQRTPKRGEYNTMPSDAAAKGPPRAWTFTDAHPTPCPLTRYHIHHPWPCDERAWATVCPRPEGWEAT
jgi:hypothetical protein